MTGETAKPAQMAAARRRRGRPGPAEYDPAAESAKAVAAFTESVFTVLGQAAAIIRQLGANQQRAIEDLAERAYQQGCYDERRKAATVAPVDIHITSLGWPSGPGGPGGPGMDPEMRAAMTNRMRNNRTGRTV